MPLAYTTITGSFVGPDDQPLSGQAIFTPNVTTYAAGIPVLTAGVPITAAITAGQLLTQSGGPFKLLATDNSGLSFEGLTGFLIYTVTVVVAGITQDPWSFALPSSPSTVELFALANTGAGGGGGGSGTVTSVSVATANGLAGTVANPSTTPAITLRTTVTGLLKGNGTSVSAAVSGTDYAPATSGSAILKGNGSGGFSAAVANTDYAPPASPTFTGTVTVPATVNATDAAQKAYVDSVAQGLDSKPSVTVVATSNITLSGAQTIDGVAVVAGNRVLATGQSTSSQNGIWTVASGAWTRPSDFATGSTQLGAFVFAEGGTVNGSSGWTLVGTSAVTVDTSSQSWTQFSGAGEITAGTGLSKSGNTLSLATPVALANGGTGAASQQAALDALAGAVTSGQYLRGNGTHVQLAAIQAGDVPTLNQSTTGNAATAANLAGAATFPAEVSPHVVTLTQSAGAVAVNGALGNVFRLVLTASGWTLSNPTGMTDGQPVRVRLIQDATGSRTISYGSAWDFGAAGAPVLSTAASKVDYIIGEWSADANGGAGAVVVSSALGF